MGNTMHYPARIVIDTNVWVAALRSRLGASFLLVSQLGGSQFQTVVTVPLLMEYEDVLMRPGTVPLAPTAVEDLLDYLCSTAIHQTVHFLWRPRLSDLRNDMVLEAAVNGRCDAIITWNLRDFAPAAEFGIQVLTPQTFLRTLKGPSP